MQYWKKVKEHGRACAWRSGDPKGWDAALNRVIETANQHGAPFAYPPAERVFHALEWFPPEKTKVIILGQDPYHGPGQAHGLAFSVPEGNPVPPSLRNIFKEIQQELGGPPPGVDLTPWARQGVLLLNTSWTVEPHRPGSHEKWGWNALAEMCVRAALEQAPRVALLLWGRKAETLAENVPERLRKKPSTLVLKAAHPSPLSARRGFMGCGHFQAANDWLMAAGLEPINWRGAAKSKEPQKTNEMG